VGSNHQGAEELPGLPSEREQGRGGRPRSPPEREQGRGRRGRAEVVRGCKASSPTSVRLLPWRKQQLLPHGRSDFFFVRPGDRSSRRRISSESTGDVGGGIDVEREGRRSFGSEGRSSGEERSRGERPPAHGREQRSPTGQEVAAAQGKAATPRLFPFACWRRHLLPSLVCTVETMQTSFCLSDLQHLVGLSLRL
jgi:hypothetical protein